MERRTQQGIDSRALFAVFITRLPVLLLWAVAGAVLGSGLHLLTALVRQRDTVYVSETEYYIDFAPGRYEAKDYYNAFTWNDVVATDPILGKAMDFLGSGYDRNQVRDMITADILSDVRYLTITVRGEKPDEVAEIRDALQTALEAYGGMVDEFDAIYKIEDLEIVPEEIPYFAWRAAFLGGVLFLGAGVFGIAFRFGIGSVFYAKDDIAKVLGIPAYGMTFCGAEGKDGAGGLAGKQAGMLERNLKMLTDRQEDILLMDASDGRYAEAFLQDMRDNTGVDTSCMKRYHMEQELKGAAILVVIPFGKTYREKITDEINFARLHGGRIEGAVLTGADRIWGKVYYASFGKEEGNRK